MAAAAIGGHIECLRYLHGCGYRWDSRTTSGAAEKGQYICLRYACEHGCPSDERIAIFAATRGQFACLVYAHQHGCAMPRDILRHTADPYHRQRCGGSMIETEGVRDCIKYLVERGYGQI